MKSGRRRIIIMLLYELIYIKRIIRGYNGKSCLLNKYDNSFRFYMRYTMSQKLEE